MSLGGAMIGGLAGACALTITHEAIRHSRVPGAPRMDILGARGLKKILTATGLEPPRGQALFESTLAADLVSNAATYALVGTGKSAPLRGTLLGAALGLGAVLLPEPLGLGQPPGKKSPRTELLTLALYTLGGLTAGCVARQFYSPSKNTPRERLQPTLSSTLIA
jgi:hypothetical protein